MRRVVLEGCNGDWAQKHYLSVLLGNAAKGNIELWMVDIEDKIKLGSLQKDWQVAQSRNGAHYLNKNKDTKIYRELSNANYVFIVAPDRFHSIIATFWLERLAPEGKIFIEKPLDSSVEPVLKLKEKIEKRGKKEAVFAFDHYLARVYPFLQDSARYLKEIGDVKKIELHILEASELDQAREETLDKGMIFDLFCHVLALVYATVNQNLTCSANTLQTVKLEEVKTTRYTGCRISGETFAWIKFTINGDIEVVSAMGKCVGTFDDKFMRLWGPKGKIELDFVKDAFLISDSNEKQIKDGELLSEHVKNFLEETLQGKKPPLSAPGVLSFDQALDILTILDKALDKAKRQISEMPEYQCNDSIDKILGILKEREL